MAKKLSNKNLLIAFVILLALVGGLKFLQDQDPEGTLKGKLVKPLDSGDVSRLEILPEFDTNNQVILVKKQGNWKLKRGEEFKALDPKRLKRALSHLYKELEADRLVSRDKKDWAKYKVDSSGSLLRIYKDGKLSDELVLGKMNFKNKNQASNYVRNLDAKSVYAVEAYLDGSLKGKPEDWLKGKGSSPGGKGISPKMRQKLQRKKMMQKKLKQMNKDSLAKNLK